MVFLETEDEWLQRMQATAGEGSSGDAEGPVLPRHERVRLVGGRESVAALHAALAVATGGDPDLAVYDAEVTAAARIELLPFVHEQSVSITAHRYGNPDPWSASVI